MGFLEKWFESLDYEYEILANCTRNISPRSLCDQCINVCEYEAISLQKGKPVIANEKCTECGKCISACPVQAIGGIYPRRSFLQNSLVITPQDVPTAKELVVLNAKGIKEIIADSEELLTAWEETIKEANEMLADLGKEPYKVKIGQIKPKEESYTRRELFSLWKKESTAFLKMATPAKWRFNHEDFNLSKHYPDYQFAQITIDLDKCTVCSACERICPKKCFSIQEEKLLIYPQECTNCHICADICPEKAIVIENKINKKESEPISLKVYKNTCQTCERTFEALTPEENKCIVCKKRELFIS